MKQIWNFICVQEFSHPLFNQITVDTTCCDVSRNHQKHHVGNKVNKPAKIQFRIHLWYWMMPDWLLVYFISRHLGRIWNCSFCRYTWLYVTTHTWLCGKFLKHWNMANSLMANGGTRTTGYEICTTMEQIMARWWSDNINTDNMLI